MSETADESVRSNRYAFEKAQEVLEAYVREVDKPQVYRAWWILLATLSVLATAEGRAAEGEEVYQQDLANAWEDLRVCLMGHGENFLTGAVLGFYTALADEDAYDLDFFELLTEAFDAAEEATPEGVTRRYTPSITRLREWADADEEEDAFSKPVLPPMTGPRLDAWARLGGLDVEATRQAAASLMKQWEGREEAEPVPPVPYLRLVVNNEE